MAVSIKTNMTVIKETFNVMSFLILIIMFTIDEYGHCYFIFVVFEKPGYYWIKH